VAATILQYYATGRRKRAVARVFLRPGSGDFKVNGRTLDDYFTMVGARIQARQPLLATETAEKFDVLATVIGGGIIGQGGAVKLGVARALIEFNSELRGKLKEMGFLTRDAREHERKKYGQKGARARFQFSKR
jgi:small subunit ribosomal protein S9